MQRKRRSGRIAKELPIVLLGTDTTGRVFSEETKTVVLSRHGAGVVTRYRFSPDELLTLRLYGSTKEAEVRLVGQIGGEPGRYVYGVAFVDPDPDFWSMEFPPPDPFEPAIRLIALECSMCQTRAEMEQGDIEEDVYAVNGNILRHCAECGTSTPWKKAEVAALPASPARPARPNSNSPPLTTAPKSSKPLSVASEPSFVESFEPTLAHRVRPQPLRHRLHTPPYPPFRSLLHSPIPKSLRRRPALLLCSRRPYMSLFHLPKKLRSPRLSSRKFPYANWMRMEGA
jgi:hypothetical protein